MRLQSREDLEALVRTPIVDDDDFVGAPHAPQRARQLLVELFQARRLVPDRNHDTEVRFMTAFSFERPASIGFDRSYRERHCKLAAESRYA